MQFNSTIETGIDSSEFSLQLPAKYTLSVLDSHEVQLVREAYDISILWNLQFS